jgi:phenylalanyl-tRNA synthetase beta chain
VRAPLSWIREFTPVDADPATVADALDNLGLEVEAVDALGEEILDVTAAKVLEVDKHPNADKLSLVEIQTGDGTTSVVCGAPNVVAGMVVPYARSGSSLPGGFKLERRKIRGIVSDGMLCSAKELGLGEDHSGILGLPEDTELGADVRDVLELHDVVFDLSITPNRPDAMSIVGVARDLAAHFGLAFSVPEPRTETAGGATGDDLSVVVEAPDRCLRFTARRIEVTMGQSPAWLARRLALAGMRPISNVVDVTNYVLLERGQPLHAFDLGRLRGRGIVVRLADAGEKMKTLDDVERTLTAEDLLVCDAERRPQAIAGIMGGAEAEVHDGTTEILLEAAYFQPMGISRTSKRLGLRSESSARFERGIDPNGVLTGSTRAAELLREVAGATVAPDPIDLYPQPVAPARITVRVPRVEALLGVELGADRVQDSLRPLEIGIEDATADGSTFTAVAPTFRPDLEREIDIVEEVARRIGFNQIARTLPHTTGAGGGLTARQRDRRVIEDVLVGTGASEAMTVPLIAVRDLERFGLSTDGTVEATNALRAEEPILRPQILPGLLKAAAGNAGQGLADLALFELGHVFAAPVGGNLLPDERDHVAVLLTGTVARAPVEGDRPVDEYDAVDALRALGEALELADLRLARDATAPGFDPVRTASVLVDGKTIGQVGALAATVLQGFEVPGPAVAIEIDVDGLLRGTRRDRAFTPLSRFPASSIDLAFVVPETVLAAEIEATLRKTGGDLLESVRCFDEFRSDALGSGKRSLAFALRYRAPDRTLTDDEVGKARQRAIDSVVKKHGAELRG